MSIKTWWENLGSTTTYANKVAMEEIINPFKNDYCSPYNRKTEDQIKEEKEKAKFKVISSILKERKTVVEHDFLYQLDKLIFATRAMEAINSSKVDSPARHLVSESFYSEKAKLIMLAFEDVDMSAEAAESIFNTYVQAELDKQ